MTSHQTQRIALYAVVAATASVVLSPLLALAYFATAEGAQYLEVSTVGAWAEPARQLVGGLVNWSSAERVYATYTQALALLFPAILLTALATRAQRPDPQKRSERWGWRIALAGYGLFGFGLAAVAVMLVGGDASGPLVDVTFMGAMMPGLLLSLIGSTVLGVVFLRSGHRPRVTGWLLAFAVPLWIVGSDVLGHNSLGVVPLFVAWAASGRKAAQRSGTDPVADQRGPAQREPDRAQSLA